MDTQTPTTYSNQKSILNRIKKIYILIFLLVILIALSVTGFLYFRTQSQKKGDLISQSKIIDLTKGKVQDLKDNLGFYIEQNPAVCDQNNLNSYFKSFILGKPTKSGAGSIYGETTWNYTLQGEISNIQSVVSGIKYTLTNGENTLITQTTNNTVSWLKDPTASPSSNLVPTKINASTFSLKDKVYLYYLVKCGGNKPPLLFLEYIQKVTTPSTQSDKIASSSGDLRTWNNGLSNFYGQVKEKGDNYLILEGKSQTIKVIIPNNLSIKVVMKDNLFIPSSESDKQIASQSISISSIKDGESISITGKYDKNLLTATFVAVYR